VKDELLVKEILGVQSVVRVKTGGHYSGPNFFEGYKNTYSAGRSRKKSFRFCGCCRFRFVDKGDAWTAPGVLDLQQSFGIPLG
jgi:hypothetical protein